MSNIIIPASTGVGGYFRMEVRRNGQLVRQLPWFRNLVLNHGLAMWRINNINTLQFQLGTSNAAPAVTDTGLLAPVGSRINHTYPVSTVINKTTPPYYTETVYKAVFAENTIVGNLAEVGVYATSKNSLSNSGWFSRALLKDSGGSPTIITVLPMEEVTLYYALRLYDDTSDSSGTFTLGTENYSYESYGCTSPEYIGRINHVHTGLCRGDTNTGGGNIGLIAEFNLPADLHNNTTNTNTYIYSSSWNENTANTGMIVSFLLDYTTNLPASQAIKSLFLYNSICNPRRYVFDPPIPKDNTRKLTFKLEFTGDRY